MNDVAISEMGSAIRRRILDFGKHGGGKIQRFALHKKFEINLDIQVEMLSRQVEIMDQNSKRGRS